MIGQLNSNLPIIDQCYFDSTNQRSVLFSFNQSETSVYLVLWNRDLKWMLATPMRMWFSVGSKNGSGILLPISSKDMFSEVT